MASRVKTIEFATTGNWTGTTLAAATNRDLAGATSIYIPETGGTFAFKSVLLTVECVGDNTTAGGTTLTAPTLGIGLAAVAISSAASVNPIGNSGENEEWTFTRDVTSYFTTNWTGTAMTWIARVNFSGIATANHAAKLFITYQYDDTAAITSQIKTIRIPIESTRTLLTTTYQTIGGATAIPALTLTSGGYLPETGITIRQIFIELWGNSSIASTGAYTISIRINGVTVIVFLRGQPALISAVWNRGLANITNLDLSAARSLEAIVSTTTNRVCTFGGMIVVTYQFNASTSTTIYNSLMLGAVDTSGWIGGTTSADQGVWERSIYIEEPNTITLKESGLCLFQNDSAGYTFNIRSSGDTAWQTSYSAYVNTAGTLQCGTYSMVHRIDSGGQNGAAGISLKRGKNLYRVQFYSGTAAGGWNLSGFMILNYTSGKHTDGVSAHAHSVYQHVTDAITSTGSRVNTSGTITPTIPETNYYLIGLLYWINYSPIGNAATGAIDINFTASAEVISTDSIQGGDGWVDFYNGTSSSDSENQNGYIYAAARTAFTRWNGDPDPDRLNIKTGRKFRLSSGPLWTGSMGYWYTYNTITYIISGTCSGYDSDGSGIPIDIYRVNSTYDDLILTTTTTANGIFSTTWVDNTDTLYAVARQDDTHVGRSRNGSAA